MNVAVFRKAHFNAAHRLHNPAWSDERNKEVFGLCNNPHYHGHNYELEVKIVGKIDPETGMVVDLGWLASLIKQEIELRFDHKNLNIDTVEFRDLNPTAENIALVIWQILRAQVPEQLELGVRLYETPRNFVEVGRYERLFAEFMQVQQVVRLTHKSGYLVNAFGFGGLTSAASVGCVKSRNPSRMIFFAK